MEEDPRIAEIENALPGANCGGCGFAGPCPANDTNTRRDNWMNTQVGTDRAKKETMKIIESVLNDIIPDFEI